MTLGEWITLAGYLGGLAVFVGFAQRCGFSRREVMWLGLAAVVVGGLGARLAQHLLGGGSLLSTEAGGRTIVAGVLFGWLGVEVTKRLLGVRASTGTAFALALSLGEGIGRIGCHFNGCCFGREWEGQIAVWQSGEWRFPVQLASSAFALGLFFALWSLRGRVESGALFRLYLVAFTVGRFCLEFLRGSSPAYGPLTVAQWVCLEVLASVAVLALVVRRAEVQRV